MKELIRKLHEKFGESWKHYTVIGNDTFRFTSLDGALSLDFIIRNAEARDVFGLYLNTLTVPVNTEEQTFSAVRIEAKARLFGTRDLSFEVMLQNKYYETGNRYANDIYVDSSNVRSLNDSLAGIYNELANTPEGNLALELRKLLPEELTRVEQPEVVAPQIHEANGSEIVLSAMRTLALGASDTDVRHVVASPSRLDNLAQCPLFERDSTDQTLADIGTRVHEIFAAHDNMRSAEIALNTSETPVDNEAFFLLRSAFAYLDELVRKHGQPCGQMKELPVAFGDWYRGTVDRLLWFKRSKTACIVDLKTGFKDSSHDLQVRAYAAMVVACIKNEVENLEGHIIAPRIPGGNRILFRVEGAANVKRFMQATLIQTGAIAMAHMLALPQDAQPGLTCAKCSKKVTCGKLQSAMPLRAISGAMPTDLPAAGDMTPEAKTKRFIIAKTVKAWCEQVKDEATDAMKTGEQLPGLRLASRNVKSSIKDQALVKGYLQSKGVSAEAVVGAATLSLDDAVTLVHLQTQQDRQAIVADMMATLPNAISQPGKTEYAVGSGEA